jgi:hypothetical protein
MTGAKGEDGDKGPVGDTGPGPKGEKGDKCTGPTGPKGFIQPGQDRLLITLSSDQTVSSPKFIGLGSQAGDFDDVGLPVPTSGTFTTMVLSIKQNIGMGMMPIAPGPGESVEAYLVVIPYTGSNDYGVPGVTASAVIDFLNGNPNTVPPGTNVNLLTTLTEGNHCAVGSFEVRVNICDVFAVLINPIGFSSFKPAISLVYGSE